MAEPQTVATPSSPAAPDQRYRSLFEHHPDGIFVLGRGGALLSANPAAEQISGYGASDLARLRVDQFVTSASLPSALELFNTALAGRSGTAEIAVQHRDGHPIDLRLTLVPMFVDGSVEGAYGIAQDLTEQRLIEHERADLLERAQAAEQRAALLSEASAALAESLDYEETLSALASSMVPAFADWSAVDILQDDGSTRRLVGTVRPELRDSVQVVLQSGELVPAIPASQREFLRTGRPIVVREMTDALLQRLAANERQLELLRGLDVTGFIRVPLLARGNLLGALTFGRAGTPRRFADEDVRLARAVARRAALAVDNARLFRSAQEAVQARDEFLASASHDLRTPVTTIKAMAQVLERRVSTGTAKTDDLQEGLQTIDETAGRITALINELLDLSRLQSGRPLELERRSCDIVELARRACTAHERITPDRHIRLDTQLSSLLGLWDPLRLERVLNNLLSNALKYSPAGAEVLVSIEREGSADGEQAVLRVYDPGIGIPAADLPHIFERFYRARNVTGRPGAGIGLAGTRDIVLQHGGSIEVESAEDDGTTFTVRLPLVPPA